MVGFVVDDAKTLADLLRGTPLEGRSIDVWEMADAEVAFALPITEDECLTAWRSARALVDDIGRWPLVANAYPKGRRSTLSVAQDFRSGDGPTVISRGEQAISAIRECVKSQRPPFPLAKRLTFQLNNTRARCGTAPEPDEVLAALPNDVSDLELDKWLLEWEEQRQPTVGREDYGAPLWFFDKGSPLAFFPITSGAEILSYLDFWGEQAVPGLTPERLLAILESWRVRFDAELFAHWGTMLSLVVGRPPATLEEAWALASEQDLIAPDTTRSRTIRGLARALIGHPTWLLHSRP
jgi:hypothetical protein